MLGGTFCSPSQIDIAVFRNVEAVLIGTDQTVLVTDQRFFADGAAKNAAAAGKSESIVHIVPRKNISQLDDAKGNFAGGQSFKCSMILTNHQTAIFRDIDGSDDLVPWEDPDALA